MNAVEIDGLTYTYPGAPQPTLKEISLQIEKGDFLAVVGNNGCGKSTLCKVLNGLIPHFITGTMEGSVRVERLDTRESDVGVLAQKVGYVYQDFENQIVRPTVLDDASYACLNYAFPDYLERGRTALRQCGLEGREEALQRVEELEECNIFPPQVTQAAHRLRRAGRLPAGIPLPTTVEGGKTAFARLHYISRERPAPAVPDGESAVSFQDVSLAYRSVKGEPHTVFDGLNLNIRKGEKVALIGSNGAGKSTLMKLMVGLLKPQAGTVSLFGEAIGDKKAEDLSRQISLVYQNPEEMFIKDSIRADIAYAMEVRNAPEWEKRTAELLERFRLTELQDRDGRLMSGGQMRRASLAIGIALNPGILLLDEPTANLDIATRREIMAVLDDMKDIIQTAVIATHDMQLVCQWAERIIVLRGGRVVADCARDAIFARSGIVEQVGIRPPEIFSMAQALDRRAMCYTIDEFLSSFQEV